MAGPSLEGLPPFQGSGVDAHRVPGAHAAWLHTLALPGLVRQIRQRYPAGLPLGLKAVAAAAALAWGLCGTSIQAADEKAGVGYLRSRYTTFQVKLIPAKTDALPPGAPRVLTAKGTAGQAEVPAGEYYVADWTVEGDDAQGRHWHAKGNMLPDPITVRAGEETKVRVADPLQAHLIVYAAQEPIGFRLELTGPSGERCREIRMNGQYIPHPQLDVLDPQGKLVERITFQGRCGGTCLTTWAAPSRLKGQFTALPNVDFGPFPAEAGAGVTFTLNASRVTMPKAHVGQTAPDFTLTASDATLAQLSFLRGRPVLLCFFCSCGLCKAVAAELGRRPELARRAHHFAVFSDPAYGEPATRDTFLKETAYPGKLLLDLAASVTLQYQSPECPRLWAIDANGTARHATPDRLAPAARIVDDALRALR